MYLIVNTIFIVTFGVGSILSKYNPLDFLFKLLVDVSKKK